MKKSVFALMLLCIGGFAFLSHAADSVIEPGKQVKLDYTLSVDNKEIETSIGKQPLQFVVGDKSIIPGLEAGIVGMHVGEEKLVTVESKDAYGISDPKALKEFPISTMPKGVEPKPGMVLQAQAPDGESFPATIKEVKEDKVVLDFNHPLAGKQLKFQVKVLDITQAPVVPAVQVPAPVAADVKK